MTHPLISDGDLILYGFVGGSLEGDDFFMPQGFTARDVMNALSEMDGDIVARINSPGGLAEEGVAVYRALRAYKGGQVTTKVDAIAASSASIIAMAGAKIVIPEASLLMIHEASGFTFGTRKDHLKSAEVLDKIDGQMATIYAARTGLEIEAVREMMAAETWLDGKEAVEKGFADEAPSEALSIEPAAFDYRVYAHAPDRLKQRAARASQSRSLVAQLKETGMSSKPNVPADKPVEVKSAAPEASAKPATVAELRAQFPELVQQVEAAAANAERERILGIEAALLPGHEQIIAAHKADPAKTPADAALAVLKAERERGDQHLAARAADEKTVAGLRSEPAHQPAPAAKPSAQDIAERARAYRAQQEKLGNKISAAEAVAHVQKEFA